jgi:hypothetical protein
LLLDEDRSSRRDKWLSLALTNANHRRVESTLRERNGDPVETKASDVRLKPSSGRAFEWRTQRSVPIFARYRDNFEESASTRATAEH